VLALAATWPGDPGLGLQILFIPAAAIVGALAVAGCPTQLAWGALAYIGRISYRLYLWRGLVIWWALPWPAAVPLSIAIASVSYFLLERRFLRLKDRFGKARPVDSPAPEPAATPSPA
jgi:peptidoglycan/LPS O-acetylase OafA/YrhL